TPECPEIEVLLQPTRPANVEIHVRSCAHCLSELELWNEFEAAEPRAAEREDLAWIEGELARRSSPVALAPPSLSVWNRVQSWLAGALAPGRQRAFALVAASLMVVAVSAIYFRQG